MALVMDVSVKVTDLGSIKEGQYIVIDGEPCKVVSVEKSKPGKHGSAKARVTAIGIFDGQKRSIVAPVDTKVSVPIISKRAAQVISVSEDFVQVMDLETYETYEVPKPEEAELAEKISPGVEVEVWDVLGRKIIKRLR